MSGMDFALEGPSGESFAEWEYTEARDEEVSFDERHPTFAESHSMINRSLRERVIQNHSETHTFSLVDNVVRVQTLNAEKRAEKADFWKHRQAEMMSMGIAGLAGTLAAALFGVTASSFAIGWVILGVGSLAASILGFVRMSQASHQVDQWNIDLPVAVANQRKVAFEEGLVSIMHQDESSRGLPIRFAAILTATELQGLYHQFFGALVEEFGRCVSSQDQIALIERVASYSPLAQHVTSYAKVFPEALYRMDWYIQEHYKFTEAYNTIEGRRREQEENVCDLAEEKIAEVNRQEKQALSIIEETYLTYKEEADLERAHALSLAVGEHRLAEIEQDYQSKVDQAGLLRDIATSAIRQPYTSQRESIVRERDTCLHNIRVDRDTQLLPFFNYLRQLHIDAYRTYMGQGPAMYPQLGDPRQMYWFEQPVFTQPAPSAPQIGTVYGDVVIQNQVDPNVLAAFMRAYQAQQQAG